MKFTVTIVAALFLGSVASAPAIAKNKRDNGYYHGQGGQPTQISNGHHGEHHEQQHGYSGGDSLKSIAQGSADQANLAVAEQYSVAKQAAYDVQNTLAQTAAQASATAQAALAGKEVLFHALEQQYIEAQKSLESELQQFELAKRASKSGQQSTQLALSHVTDLQNALNSAESALNQAQFTASETAAELAAQSAMVGRAKARLAALGEQLNYAHVDFSETQAAAQKAASAAHTAQTNAAAAAVEQTKYAGASSGAVGYSNSGKHH